MEVRQKYSTRKSMPSLPQKPCMSCMFVIKRHTQIEMTCSCLHSCPRWNWGGRQPDPHQQGTGWTSEIQGDSNIFIKTSALCLEHNRCSGNLHLCVSRAFDTYTQPNGRQLDERCPHLPLAVSLCLVAEEEGRK